MRIDVVGPCASGKSLLVSGLRDAGYDAHQCSQEHSDIPDMWRKFCRSDVLIYLDATIETIAPATGYRLGGERAWLHLQARLADARAHCDLLMPPTGCRPMKFYDEPCATCSGEVPLPSAQGCSCSMRPAQRRARSCAACPARPGPGAVARLPPGRSECRARSLPGFDGSSGRARA